MENDHGWSNGAVSERHPFPLDWRSFFAGIEHDACEKDPSALTTLIRFSTSARCRLARDVLIDG
jgi:hypothetical protein